MKRTCAVLLAALAVLLAFDLLRGAAANSAGWAGEFNDKKFLNGRAVFQLSIIQEGTKVSVDFDAVYNDGHGCAPLAYGPAKVIDKNTLAFTFDDNLQNAGSGTITRAGDDVIMSIKATRVANRECLVFYGQNMRLKRAGKK